MKLHSMVPIGYGAHGLFRFQFKHWIVHIHRRYASKNPGYKVMLMSIKNFFESSKVHINIKVIESLNLHDLRAQNNFF